MSATSTTVSEQKNPVSELVPEQETKESGLGDQGGMAPEKDPVIEDSQGNERKEGEVEELDGNGDSSKVTPVEGDGGDQEDDKPVDKQSQKNLKGDQRTPRPPEEPVGQTIAEEGGELGDDPIFEFAKKTARTWRQSEQPDGQRVDGRFSEVHGDVNFYGGARGDREGRKGSGKASDPTAELEHRQLKFQPTAEQVDTWTSRLDAQGWVVLVSEDVEIAATFACAVTRRPEYINECAKRWMEIDSESELEIRNYRKLLGCEIDPRNKDRKLIVVDARSAAAEPFLTSLVGASEQSRAQIAGALRKKKWLWIVATTPGRVGETRSSADLAWIDFLPPRLQRAHPHHWRQLQEQVVEQRRQGRWPAEDQQFFEICDSLLRQERFAEEVEKQAKCDIAELKRSRQADIGLEGLLDPERYLEAAVHFVVTFFPGLSVKDSDRLLKSLLESRQEEREVKFEAGVAWSEERRSLLDVWVKERQRISQACGLIVLPPGTAAGRPGQGRRKSPALDYRDPRLRVELREFFWTQGHVFFLEQLEHIPAYLLADPSHEIRESLSELVAATADAYPEHFGQAWLAKVHLILSTTPDVAGGWRRIGALELLVGALLKRRRARRTVGPFLSELQQNQPAIHRDLTRRLRFTKGFDALEGWRKAFAGGRLLLVPQHAVGGLSVEDRSTLAAFGDVLAYCRHPQGDLEQVTYELLDWLQDASSATQRSARLVAGATQVLVQLAFESVLEGKSVVTEPGPNQVERGEGLDSLLAILLAREEGDEPVALRRLLGAMFQSQVAAVWQATLDRLTADALDRALVGGPAIDQAGHRELHQAVRRGLEVELHRAWIRSATQEWLIGPGHRGLKADLGQQWLEDWGQGERFGSFELRQAVVVADWWIRLEAVVAKDSPLAAAAGRLLRRLPAALADSMTGPQLGAARRHWSFLRRSQRRIRIEIRRQRRHRGDSSLALNETIDRLSARKTSLGRLDAACRQAIRRKGPRHD